ncbi:hypothetical protein [Mycolicibacterium litorale]|uniref:Uncharacterized protein n=1 Tax=Mycolicibacterium litorale TaxID=758802 RepID=A0AAD1MW66_9MYCO|nr:hypothetical protein [Mycolicibacterium litorale]MCV7416949.1 hypothetical protein [Mycolicibacterium litorale]TDY04734.1 hypothetical protein BCL50_3511 [Mycolicibacterium litorale]BBY18162.1 hypothetical protein MLIT_37540 [Mycolicibacterium litorale]
MVTHPDGEVVSRRTVCIGVGFTLVVLVAGLLWAKWTPYLGKALAAAQTHHWPGSDILGAGGVRAGGWSRPHWPAALTLLS